MKGWTLAEVRHEISVCLACLDVRIEETPLYNVRERMAKLKSIEKTLLRKKAQKKAVGARKKRPLLPGMTGKNGKPIPATDPEVAFRRPQLGAPGAKRDARPVVGGRAEPFTEKVKGMGYEVTQDGFQGAFPELVGAGFLTDARETAALSEVVAAFAPEERKAFGEWVARRKVHPFVLVVEALREALKRESNKLVGMLPRHRRMSDDMVRVYGEQIAAAVEEAASSERDWVVVNYNDRTVTVSAKHPGNGRGVVVLSVRAGKDLEEWTDKGGRITPRAVTACLLGFGRPEAEAQR